MYLIHELSLPEWFNISMHGDVINQVFCEEGPTEVRVSSESSSYRSY